VSEDLRRGKSICDGLGFTGAAPCGPQDIL
jgi:hypothetical protein